MANTSSLPQTQRGYGFKAGCKHIVRYDKLPVARPKGSEVLLKIEAAGMCQSDLHILIAQEPYNPEKFVMGHEIAGQIVMRGPEADEKIEVGGRYAVFICNGCGTCKNCRTGNDNMCTGMGLIPEAFGITSDGGFQEYLLVKNTRNLVPIPDDVTYEQAALASDAVLTPFHAIMKVKHLLHPGTKILVMGLGGLGLNALQILHNFDVHIVASDVKKELKDIALEYGAHEFYSNLEDCDHDYESFDICFDFCGIQPTIDESIRFIKAHGKIMMVGLGRSKLFIRNYDLARREVEVIFSFAGTSAEHEECMEWIANGKLKPLTTSASLDSLPEYLEKLSKGELQGRVVFRPSKL